MELRIFNNQNGAALLTSLLLMSLLTIVGVSALSTTDIELKIAGNEKSAAQALYAAEAGVYSAIAELTADIDGWDTIFTAYENDAGLGQKISEPSESGSVFTYIIEDNVGAASGTVKINATGTAHGSEKKITAIVHRPSGTNPYINYAGFGDEKLVIKNSGIVRSYDSTVTPNPSDHDTDGDGIADDETGGGDVGSNGEVELKNKAYVGGEVALGADADGNVAALSDSGAIVTGTESLDADGNLVGVNVGPVDADALFTDGGAVEAGMAVLAAKDAAGELTELFIGKDETVVLGTPGTTTNLYYSEINTKNSGEIQIQGTVNVFTTGAVELKNGVTFNNTGAPADFAIFSTTTDIIDLRNSSSFAGLVYAPYADVVLHNSGDLFGSIYAKTLDIRNSGDIWFDTAISDAYGSVLSDKLKILSWRQD